MLADLTDLAAYLGRTLTATEETQATLLLQASARSIRRFTRQTITRVDSDAVVLQGNWGSVLVLPERPVVSISSVAINGTSLTVNEGYTWDGGDKLYRGRRTINTGTDPTEPWPYRHELYWGGPSAQVAVTYSHGWVDVPEDIRAISCAMVARAMSTPAGVKSETTGPFSVSYTAGADSAITMTRDERRALRDLRR